MIVYSECGVCGEWRGGQRHRDVAGATGDANVGLSLCVLVYSPACSYSLLVTLMLLLILTIPVILTIPAVVKYIRV